MKMDQGPGGQVMPCLEQAETAWDSSVPGEPRPGPERRSEKTDSLAGSGVAEALHLTFDLSSPELPAGPARFSNLASSSTTGTQLPWEDQSFRSRWDQNLMGLKLTQAL